MEYLEELQTCKREDMIGDLEKEGLPVYLTSDAFSSPCVDVWNAERDLDLPCGGESLASRIAQRYMRYFCKVCTIDNRFVMASATDFCLKEYSDEAFYRETLVGPVYVLGPYDSVMQSGQDNFGIEEEKIIKMLRVTYLAAQQTTPSLLYAFMSYGPAPQCEKWRQLKVYWDDAVTLMDGRPLRCLTDETDEEHEIDGTRADRDAVYPCQVRGKFLQYRLKISGTGGSACFSRVAVDLMKVENH